MARALGLGCMRLSTDAARPADGDALAVLAAALAAGITLLDTADAYALAAHEAGHNERLIARALAALPAGAPRPRVVTKGGLVRPDGAWVPDGRARYLAAAARASRDRLGHIDLYLLHAPDPKVPLATSVRALGRLVADGIVGAIGLSNVNATQLEAALALAPIAAVEVELHPYALAALRGGVVAACEARGLELLAHRPLGGPAGVARLGRDPVVLAHAARLAATPAELALAWLRAQSPAIVPLPGATRIATACSAARLVELDEDARRALDAHWLEVRGARASARSALAMGENATTATATAAAAAAATDEDATAAAATDEDATPRASGAAIAAAASAEATGAGSALTATAAAREVVVILGIPGAGKSTLAQDLVARGYERLNRDERGGTLLELARALDDALAAGAQRIVLDNTYPSRASRRPVIDIARRHGAQVRCIVVDTPIERAQRNAVARLLARHGRLLPPEELRRAAEIGPGAQFRWRREYEPPRTDEGFARVDVVPFAPREEGAAPPRDAAAALRDAAAVLRDATADDATADDATVDDATADPRDAATASPDVAAAQRDAATDDATADDATADDAIASSLRDATAPPRDVTAAPPDATAPPRDATAAQRDVAAAQRDAATGDAATGDPRAYARRDGAAAPPRDVTAPPSDVTAARRDAIPAPRDVTAPPGDVTAAPPDATAAPRDATAAQCDVAAVPRDAVTGDAATGDARAPAPRDATAAQRDVAAAQRDDAAVDAATGDPRAYARRDATPAPRDTTAARRDATAGDALVIARRPALLAELDDVVWRGRPRTVDKLAVRDGARDALRAWHAAGYALAATSWQPGGEPARFAALVAALVAELGVPLHVLACEHPAGPPVCWCRKPLPGLALALAHAHGLAFELAVGSGAADRGSAVRAGIPFHDTRDGWPAPGTLAR